MHNIQLMQIQPEERLAAPSELNLAPCPVTGCCEAMGMGCWAATRPITYLENDRAVLLESRMRENIKSGSVRGLIVTSERRWL